MFQRCPRKFYYRYVLGLEVPKTKHMEFGTDFHKMMQAAYSAIRDKSDPIIAAHAAGSNDPLLHDVFDYYWEHVGSKDEFDEILSVEEPVNVVVGDARVKAMFDLTAYRGGRTVLMDHKTVTTIAEEYLFLPLDFQVRMYSYLAHTTYPGEVDFIYNIVRREVPPGFGSRSEKTKSGRPSKASQRPEDYLKRIRLTMSRTEVEAFRDRIDELTWAMKRAANSGVYLRVPIKSGGEACGRCPYYTPCVAEMRGQVLDKGMLSMIYSTHE